MYVRIYILMIAAWFATDVQAMQTSTHFGFATQAASTLGFKRHAGSTLFLDSSFAVADQLSLGLRTSGLGSAGQRENFYRMAAGPLLQWTITETWSLDMSITRFSESGQLDNEQKYTSRGNAIMLGWERLSAISDRLTLAWGGFWQKHAGDVRTDVAHTRLLSTPNHNHGDTRGIKIALRILL